MSGSHRPFTNRWWTGQVRGGEGNERLTATTAVVLIALLAAEGATILRIRGLVSAHIFIGMLLIPPVALKLASTGYRFMRYYAGAAAYRAKGPPRALLRFAVAPVTVASTIVVFGTGVALLVRGPGGGLLLGLHKAGFVVWLGATSVHVLVYLSRLPALAAADWRRAQRIGGGVLRLALVLAVLAAGAVLAASTLPLAHPWARWARELRLHDREGESGAHVDRAPRVRSQALRNRPAVDHRVAPVVEPDQLREQLGAQPVAVARDRVDAQDVAHRTNTSSALATS
jgi:hypothetical protein